MLSIAWMYHLAGLAKIVLYNPERDFWRTSTSTSHRIASEKTDADEQKKANDHQAETMHPFTLAKLYWAISLLFSFRGEGWNWRVKGVPPSPSITKAQFTLRMFASLLLSFLAMSFVTQYLTALHFHSAEQTVSALGLWKRTLILGAIAVQSYGSCWWNYGFIGVVRVMTGEFESKVCC